MIIPGDIIKITRIIKTDIQGLLHCATATGVDILSKRALSPNEYDIIRAQIEGGEMKVIVVGFKNKTPLFELDSHFERDLVSHYYEKRNRVITGKGKNIPHWELRWASGANGKDIVKCLPISKKMKKVRLPSHSLWKTLCAGTWRLPVFAHRTCDWLPDGGPYRFCPSAQYEYGFTSPACVRTTQGFPRRLQAALSQQVQTGSAKSKGASTPQKKHITLLLHGFLSPKQGHYKFWKHVVAGTPSAEAIRQWRNGKLERDFWKKTLPSSPPANSIFLTAQCREHVNQKGKPSTCEYCDYPQFSAVHDQIRPSLDEYLAEAVTILTSSTTKLVKMKKQPGSSLRHRICVGCVDMGNVVNGFCKKLALDGYCFNWEDEQPLVHLFVRTLYSASPWSNPFGKDLRDDLFWKDPGVLDWRIDHVSE
jgi:hypothetical protein